MYSIEIVRASSLDVPTENRKTYLLDKAKFLIRKQMGLELRELIFGDDQFALRASAILKWNGIKNRIIIQ
jgi:hypothetical protein